MKRSLNVIEQEFFSSFLNKIISKFKCDLIYMTKIVHIMNDKISE